MFQLSLINLRALSQTAAESLGQIFTNLQPQIDKLETLDADAARAESRKIAQAFSTQLDQAVDKIDAEWPKIKRTVLSTLHDDALPRMGTVSQQTRDLAGEICRAVTAKDALTKPEQEIIDPDLLKIIAKQRKEKEAQEAVLSKTKEELTKILAAKEFLDYSDLLRTITRFKTINSAQFQEFTDNHRELVLKRIKEDFAARNKDFTQSDANSLFKLIEELQITEQQILDIVKEHRSYAALIVSLGLAQHSTSADIRSGANNLSNQIFSDALELATKRIEKNQFMISGTKCTLIFTDIAAALANKSLLLPIEYPFSMTKENKQRIDKYYNLLRSKIREGKTKKGKETLLEIIEGFNFLDIQGFRDFALKHATKAQAQYIQKQAKLGLD